MGILKILCEIYARRRYASRAKREKKKNADDEELACVTQVGCGLRADEVGHATGTRHFAGVSVNHEDHFMFDLGCEWFPSVGAGLGNSLDFLGMLHRER